MRNERKILRFVPQKLCKSFANGNPTHVVYYKNKFRYFLDCFEKNDLIDSLEHKI